MEVVWSVGLWRCGVGLMGNGEQGTSTGSQLPDHFLQSCTLPGDPGPCLVLSQTSPDTLLLVDDGLSIITLLDSCVSSTLGLSPAQPLHTHHRHFIAVSGLR